MNCKEYTGCLLRDHCHYILQQYQLLQILLKLKLLLLLLSLTALFFLQELCSPLKGIKGRPIIEIGWRFHH